MELKCPNCGNDGTEHAIEWVEMCPSHREIHGLVDGKLYISDGYKDFPEASEGSALFCQKCFTQWDVPESWELVFGETPQKQAR